MYYNKCKLNCENRKLNRGEKMTKTINLPLIKATRLRLGYTNKEMASALGLSGADKYYRREQGEYNFKATELPALSHVLHIPLEKIFT